MVIRFGSGVSHGPIGTRTAALTVPVGSSCSEHEDIFLLKTYSHKGRNWISFVYISAMSLRRNAMLHGNWQRETLPGFTANGPIGYGASHVGKPCWRGSTERIDAISANNALRGITTAADARPGVPLSIDSHTFDERTDGDARIGPGASSVHVKTGGANGATDDSLVLRTAHHASSHNTEPVQKDG